MGTAHGDWYVKSVEKAFSVLGAFTEDQPLQSVSEVAAAADMSRAAARRFLLTLAELGYLSTDGTRFQLAPRVLNIGSAFLSNLTLPAIAEPHLKSLSADLQETASVCILDDVHVVYVARVTSPRLVSVAVHVGTRFPAWATSMGRVLLGALDETDLMDRIHRSDVRRFTARTVPSKEALLAEIQAVRERGWSVVREEYEEGLSGVAVPVHRAGRVVAAANVSLHQPYGGPAGLEEVLLPRLRRAAADISADYGIRLTG
ncbi:MAG: IclR family transcriptional regulator C-terminal domain-containing protein [Arthrobacter sp.]